MHFNLQFIYQNITTWHCSSKKACFFTKYQFQQKKRKIQEIAEPEILEKFLSKKHTSTLLFCNEYVFNVTFYS